MIAQYKITENYIDILISLPSDVKMLDSVRLSGCWYAIQESQSAKKSEMIRVEGNTITTKNVEYGTKGIVSYSDKSLLDKFLHNRE